MDKVRGLLGYVVAFGIVVAYYVLRRLFQFWNWGNHDKLPLWLFILMACAVAVAVLSNPEREKEEGGSTSQGAEPINRAPQVAFATVLIAACYYLEYHVL